MYEYGVAGGDIRQKYLAEYLAQAGYSVFCYGVESDTCARTDNIEELTGNVRNLVLPVPITKDGKNLHAVNVYKKTRMEDMIKSIPPCTTVFAGSVNKCIRKMFMDRGIKIYDYLEDKYVLYMNSAATAEGTIAEMICHSKTMLEGKRVLVLGYGNCARPIVARLIGMGAKVTVCVRNVRKQNEIQCKGIRCINFQYMSNEIGKYEYIVNTVPAMVIDRNLLLEVDKNTLIIDIASAPGGVDIKEAGRQGINCVHSLGIPGRYCPAAMAKAYSEYILRVSAKHV